MLATLTLALLLIGVLVALAAFFINWLADGDIMFTKVGEGTAKAIMRGESFDHFICSLKHVHLNDPRMPWHDPDYPDWEVLENEKDANGDELNYETRNAFLKWLGIYFIGIPPFTSSYIYKFDWNEYKIDTGENNASGKGRQVIRPRSARTNFIYIVPFPYVMVLHEAETGELLTVDVEYQTTVTVSNPFKALFKTENWMERVTAATNRVARSFVGGHSYDNLKCEANITTRTVDHQLNFSTPITFLTQALVDERSGTAEDDLPADWRVRGTRGRYGIIIEAADVQRVDPSGTSAAEIHTSALKRFNAENDAYVELTVGKAKASVIEMTGRANAKSLALRLRVIKAAGDTGALLAQLDAMQAPGEGRVVLWANNPWIAQQDGLAEILKQSGVSIAELRTLLTDAAAKREDVA